MVRAPMSRPPASGRASHHTPAPERLVERAVRTFGNIPMSFDIAPPVLLQPYVKLAQSNMELWNRFAFSPEIQAEAARNVQALVEQAQTSAAHLMQSQAFAGLVQGLMKNYTEFVSELGQATYSIASQGQAALLQRTQEMTANVIDVAARRR
jgi:hypothetical protein